MANISIIGADQLTRNISKRVGRDKVNGVIKKNTAQMQQNAMRGAAVDTGFMRRSITMETQPMFLSGEVTAGAEYSPYVEFSTRFMTGQPFMRPARNEQAPIFLSDLRNMIRRG